MSLHIENRCVMPLTGNGQSFVASKEHHEWFQAELIDRFGGYTLAYGIGGWKAPTGLKVEEQVAIYDVSMEGLNADTDRVFAGLSEELGRRLNQRCVYLRIAGVVRLIPTQKTNLHTIQGSTAA